MIPPICFSRSGTITTGNPVSAVSLSESKFQIPGIYTVQFQISGRNMGLSPHTIAEISWRVAGNIVRRVISVNNGTSISAVCEGVSVLLKDDSKPITPQTYDGVITVSHGSRGANEQPPIYNPLTTYAGNTFPGGILIPALTNAGVDVPVDAGVISVFTTASGFNDPVIFTEDKLQVQQLGASMTKCYDPRLPQWVPIGDGVSTLFFKNKSAVDVFFGFTFGIDG